MLSVMHHMIGRILVDTCNIPNPSQFLHAVIDVDICRETWRQRHTFDDTYGIFHTLCNECLTCIDDETFSYKLGMIAHYIMDYFSKYHRTNTIYRKTLKHITFELSQYLMFIFYPKEKIKAIFFNARKDIFNNEESDIINIIKAELTKYDSTEGTFNRDIEYLRTVYICLSIIISERESFLKK